MTYEKPCGEYPVIDSYHWIEMKAQEAVTMGYAESKMLEIEERRYGESDKLVCSVCVKDSYMTKIIRKKGTVGSSADHADRGVKKFEIISNSIHYTFSDFNRT